MFQVKSILQDKYSFSEYFSKASDQWGSFSFGSSVQKYTLYILTGIVVLILIRVAVKAICNTRGKEEVTDSPYRLRKLSTRIEHFKRIVSTNTAFTYRFFDEKGKENNWHKGRFLSMEKKRNLILELSYIEGKPRESIKKILEIKYSVDKNEGIIKSLILKYVSAKKSGNNNFIFIYSAKLPRVVKLNPRRKDIRFKVSPDYPIRVYLLSDNIDIPVVADCIDFSGGGMFIELNDAKEGCMEYLIKKDKTISKSNLNEDQIEKLTLYKILSQPELEFTELREARKKAEECLEEWTDSIEMARDLISSLKKKDTVKLFFILPELPMLAETNEELLSQDNRTIMCDAVIAKTAGGKSEKYQVALHFLDIDDINRNIIYEYGLESWREY